MSEARSSNTRFFERFVSRPELYLVTLLVAFINGSIIPAIQSVSTGNIFIALGTGFGTNWIVWLAAALTLRLLATAKPSCWTAIDLTLVAVAMMVAAWPIQETGWLAMTILSLGLLTPRTRDPKLRAVGTIALAISVAKLWAKVVPYLLAGPLTAFDAHVVAYLSGRTAVGNLIFYPGGQDYVLVGWGCTSFANLSIALLLYISITRSVRPVAKRTELRIVAAILASVLAINSLRLLLETTNRDLFTALHSERGDVLFNVALVAATLVWTVYGLRRDLEIAR